MQFADAEFYTEYFLQGSQPLIPLEEFNRWAEKASNRIDENNMLDEEIIEGIDDRTWEQLQFATAEIAEIFYKDMQSRSLDAVRSYSNQGLSKTYADQTVKPEEMEKNIRGIINRRLAGTELHNLVVYKGI